MLIVGPLFWFIAIVLPFSTQYPVSPWEYEKQKHIEVK